MAKGKGKGKRKQANAFKLDAVLPTPEQIINGDFERDFITHAETNTKAMTYRNSTILEKWIKEGGPGFDTGSQRVIADCLLFWSIAKPSKVTAQYGERTPAGTNDNARFTREDAIDELHYRKKLLGAGMDWAWDVFENVVRHNEPAGVAGSRFASNRPQQIQSAKVITGMVASFIASKLGY